MRVPLPFHKVIYVMEDIDAASHVVQKRGSPDHKLARTLADLVQTSDHQSQSDLIRDQPQQKHRTAVAASTTTTTTAVQVSDHKADATAAPAGGSAADVVQVLTRATSVTHQQKVSPFNDNRISVVVTFSLVFAAVGLLECQ